MNTDFLFIWVDGIIFSILPFDINLIMQRNLLFKAEEIAALA